MEMEAASGTLGLAERAHPECQHAGNFDAVFDGLRERSAGALVIIADLLFISKSSNWLRSASPCRIGDFFRASSSPRPAGWRTFA